MDLNKAEILAKDLMIEHGVAEDWEFEWSRSVMKFGQAITTYKRGVYRNRIMLSKRLTEVRSESDVRNTILHEIAHAIVGLEHAHDKVWKAKCLEIGGNGRTTEPGFGDIAKVAKYTYHCGVDDQILRVSERRLSTVNATCRFHFGADVHRKRIERGVRVLDEDTVNMIG